MGSYRTGGRPLTRLSAGSSSDVYAPIVPPPQDGQGYPYLTP